MQKKWIKILVAIFLLIFISWETLIHRSIISDPAGFKYTVQPRTSIRQVSEELTQLNLITHPGLFKILVFLRGNGHQLKTGEYLFPQGTSLSSLLTQITTGKGIVYHVFTIIPGWTFQDLRKAILEVPDLIHASRDFNDAALMNSLGAKILQPEGQFFPDSYFYNAGSSDLILLKRAYQAMQTKLKKTWEQRDAGLPYKNAYDALIVASLIEKEAKLTEERPLIAGVILNRLKKDMLLQIDPTVIYGLGSRYDGTIRKTDLTQDTPYNTYVRKGLPPTPIAMPSLDSLQAAMHPKKHNFYYFVAKGPGESRHQFSATLIEHHQAVTEAKYFFNNALVRFYFLLNIKRTS